ncbi:MAG: lytic transglycosylase domain-containing protein [Treponema sp.]|nr:lytic transglycosylase domain-containing protein [Treponema sp.]
MKMIRSILFFSILLILFSCKETNANSPQSEFKYDSDYYYGLRACDDNKEDEAIRLFTAARKNGTDLVARRSAEALTQIGNITQRLEASKYLIERWNDDNALLIACKEFFKNQEYSQILRYTRRINLNKASNELVELRMRSLLEKNDSRFEEEYFTWTVSRPLSMHHLQFYQIYLANQLKKIHIQQESDEVQNISVSREQMVIDFRVSVYQQKYQYAFSVCEQILKCYDNEKLEVEEQLLSDIGKAALYGADDYSATAKFFDSLAEKLSEPKKFYALFYAARLYDKDGRFQAQTKSRFKSALEASVDPMQKDNCLWYLLNFLLRTSTDDIIETLKTYGNIISSPEYFDDFFESLSVLLISNHKWNDFFQVWSETGANLSEKTAAKYSYISGRLIEEGLVKPDGKNATEQAQAAFRKALSGGGSLYYKILALERLKITEKEQIEAMLFPGDAKKSDSEKENSGADGKKAMPEENNLTALSGRLLSGYVAFGFPQQIYSEWLLNRNNLKIEDTIRAATFLRNCEKYDTEEKFSYGIQSLRIASRAKNDCGGMISKELLELCYPRLYESQIADVCMAQEIPEYILFALVRTESFFDRNISSRAGAMGLTQLMEATADDEARKLKLGDYDIFDAETNLTLGAHYLKSLIGRTEKNSVLLALFAYNGGLTNVRRWIRAARSDWYKTKKKFYEPAGISMDLFLETLPFTETRDYGRQLVEASAIYAFLYYDKTPSEVVHEIMGE